MKNKYLIALKVGIIRNELEFFALLFPKSRIHPELAMKLLELSKEGKLDHQSYLTVPEELGVTRPQFYFALKKLHWLGIFNKVNDKYLLSRAFPKHLLRMAKYYETLREDTIVK